MLSIDLELCLVVSQEFKLCRPCISTSTSPGLILLSDLDKVQAQALLAPTAHPSVRVNQPANQPTPLLLKSEIDGGGDEEGGRGEYPAAGGGGIHPRSSAALGRADGGGGGG